MSSGDMHGVESALANKTDALQQRANGLIGAIHSGKNVRRMIILLLLIGIGSFSWWMFTQYKKITSEDRKKVYFAEIEKRKEQITKEALDKITKLAERKGNVVKDVFVNQFKQDAPAFTKILEGQRDDFLKSMQKRFEDAMNKHYSDLLNKQKDAIRKQLDIKSDADLKLVMDNLQIAMGQTIKKYHLERFEGELRELDKEWQSYPQATDKRKADESDATELIGIFMELLSARLVESEKPATK